MITLGLLVSVVRDGIIRAELNWRTVSVISNVSNENISCFQVYHRCFMSCNDYTGKVLCNNTLDLTDIFYDPQRTTGITYQPWCQRVLRLGLKKCSLEYKVSMAQLLCLHFPWSVLKDLTPLDTLGVLYQIQFPMKLKENGLGKRTWAYCFSLGSLPSFLSAWNLYVGICRVGLNYWTHMFVYHHLGHYHYPCQCDLLYNTSYFWWHSMISKSEMCRVQFYLNHLHDFIKFNLFIEHLIYGQSLL